jgi:hypothetical protein
VCAQKLFCVRVFWKRGSSAIPREAFSPRSMPTTGACTKIFFPPDDMSCDATLARSPSLRRCLGPLALGPSKMLLNQRMSFIIRISTCYECFSESQFAKFARWALLLDEPTFLHSVQADKDKVSGQFMKGPAGTSEPTSKTRSCSSHTAQRLRSCGGTKWRKKVKRLRPRSGQRRVPLFFQTGRDTVFLLPLSSSLSCLAQ